MGLRLRGGVWYLRKNVGGKRREVCLGYPAKERAQAEKAAVKVVSRLLDEHHGLAARPDDSTPVPTFSAWWATYRAVYSVKKANPGRDTAIVEWWLAVPMGSITWGATPLDRFKQSDCETALAYRRKAGTRNPSWKTQKEHVTEATVQRERGVIQAMFERAVEDGLIDKNPWKGVEKEADTARERLLSPDDETKLKAVLSPQFQRFVEFLLETGLRLEELRKIEQRDISGGAVHVHGKGKKRRAKCAQCKREGGKCRNVPLTTKAKQLLEQQWKAEGKLWTQTQARLRDVLQVGCVRAQIGHISPHDLRHTFGHRWLQKGGDIYTLSKILGHSSVQITERHYAHLLQPDIDLKMRSVMEPRVLKVVAQAAS